MAEFLSPVTQQPTLVTLTPGGAVPVDDDSEPGVSELLGDLIREVRELRRVQCAATDQIFVDEPPA